MAMKKFLFLTRKAPFGGGCGMELLDAAMIAASFDQQVHLAYLDDGVLNLIKGQQAEALGRRDTANALLELAGSDIDHVWVNSDALDERGLTTDDLLIPVTALDAQSLGRLMAEMDVVVSA